MWDRVRLRVRKRVLKLCWMLFYFWKSQSKRPLHFFALTNFVISISVFEHKPIRRVTWISPNGNTMNQIDLLVVTQDWKCNIKNSRSYLIIQVTLDPIIHLAWPKSCFKHYISQVSQNETTHIWCIWIDIQYKYHPKFWNSNRKRFCATNELYDKFKTTKNEITKRLVGLRKNLRVEGLSTDVQMLCQNRREAIMNMLQNLADASISEICKTPEE